MGWVYVAPQQHKCRAPNRAALEVLGANKGDVWECDECKALWRVIYDPRGYCCMEPMNADQTAKFKAIHKWNDF